MRDTHMPLEKRIILSDSAVFLQGSVQADCDLSGLPFTTHTELFQLYQLTQKLHVALTWYFLRVI